MAGFDALVLSRALAVPAGMAKVIHGDKWSTFKVKADTLTREVKRIVGKIAALLSATSPPDLILNRHCPKCEFHDGCRKEAIEKDDLSLLTNLTAKERARLKGKGIFTVTQLSYTFRPRRRSKRLADKPEKYHHSLKALAIREQKIYVVGSPRLKIGGTTLYLDVEGLPDRDYYYLVGVREESDKGIKRHSLWADTMADEERVWSTFLEILSGTDNPVLIHYGRFETTFLKRMCDRYGAPRDDSVAAKAIASSVNLLSVIFAQVYFPSYSNGLKEIGSFLGFEWADPSSSGLQSIVWRHQWEESHDPAVREKLIRYNADDCDALSPVAHTIVRLAEPQVEAEQSRGSLPMIVHAASLGKNVTSKWRPFKSPLSELEQINVAAHWNYQRDRVFVRSGIVKKKTAARTRSRRPVKKAEKVVVLNAPPSCPKCGKRGRRKERLLSRTVQDLVFGKDSVKRRVVTYVMQSYRCRSCLHEYGLHEWYLHARKWGWNVLGYFIYHIVGLRIPQLTLQKSLRRLFGFDLVRSTLTQ